MLFPQLSGCPQLRKAGAALPITALKWHVAETAGLGVALSWHKDDAAGLVLSLSLLLTFRCTTAEHQDFLSDDDLPAPCLSQYLVHQLCSEAKLRGTTFLLSHKH